MIRRVAVAVAVYAIASIAVGIVESTRSQRRAGPLLLIVIPLTILLGWILWELFGDSLQVDIRR